MNKKRLLLISNSVTFGQGYLDHCLNTIIDFLGDLKSILFIPFALKNYKKYGALAKERFKKMRIQLDSIDNHNKLKKIVSEAQAFFVGGGNTFRLLQKLYDEKLIDVIREKVLNGTPYIGVSAGANISCPTIKTTNDMPIIEVASFISLNLIPFQINPHYIRTIA